MVSRLTRPPIEAVSRPCADRGSRFVRDPGMTHDAFSKRLSLRAHSRGFASSSGAANHPAPGERQPFCKFADPLVELVTLQKSPSPILCVLPIRNLYQMIPIENLETQRSSTSTDAHNGKNDTFRFYHRPLETAREDLNAGALTSRHRRPGIAEHQFGSSSVTDKSLVHLSWPKNVIRAEISQYLFRVIPLVDQMPPVSPR
jgi:hypothetical protein